MKPVLELVCVYAFLALPLLLTFYGLLYKFCRPFWTRARPFLYAVNYATLALWLGSAVLMANASWWISTISQVLVLLLFAVIGAAVGVAQGQPKGTEYGSASSGGGPSSTTGQPTPAPTPDEALRNRLASKLFTENGVTPQTEQEQQILDDAVANGIARKEGNVYFSLWSDEDIRRAT